MKRFGRMVVPLGLVLIAGACDVTVNNKSFDNSVDAATSDAANMAEGAGAVLEQAGSDVENHAEGLGNSVERLGDRIDNGIDVDVDLGGKDEGAEANKS